MVDYSFWFWSDKLKGILVLLASLVDYDLWDEEIESIKSALIGTNDESNIWTEYSMKGRKYSLGLKLAHDAEKRTDMIHISINATHIIQEKLEALNLFQSMVKELEIER
ncbi:hypothetical protein D770_05135 [Flammeovirgaceae bacterium 311]|nr:hypothetical protein D770_05135 [Flammeovirgaceae bacterium 311]